MLKLAFPEEIVSGIELNLTLLRRKPVEQAPWIE
jgi:hypothetical protein